MPCLWACTVKELGAVTGEVVLEKPARMPVSVALFSDKDNAKLKDIKALPGGGNKAIAVRYGEDPEEYRNPARMGFEITPRRVDEFG